jgi:hypothetical protein
MLGTGKIQGWVDGQLVVTIDKPKSLNPAVLSSPLSVDGSELVVYAESADGGVSVRPDVYFNGRSLSSGEPLSAVERRMATVHRRPPAYATIPGRLLNFAGTSIDSLLSQLPESVLSFPVVLAGVSFLGLMQYPSGMVAFLVLLLAESIVTLPIYFALARAKKEGRARRRKAIALAGLPIIVVGCFLSLGLAYLIARG